jgi:hypothetical protein
MSEWYGGALDVIGGACLTALDQLAAGGTGAAVDAWNFDVCDEDERGGAEGKDDDADRGCRGDTMHKEPVAHANPAEAGLEEEVVHDEGTGHEEEAGRGETANNDLGSGVDRAAAKSVQVHEQVEAPHVPHEEPADAVCEELAEATVADVTMHLLSQGNITRTLQAEVLRVLQGHVDPVACAGPAASTQGTE